MIGDARKANNNRDLNSRATLRATNSVKNKNSTKIGYKIATNANLKVDTPVSVRSFTNKIIGGKKPEIVGIKSENTNNNNSRIDKIDLDSNSKCSEGMNQINSNANLNENSPTAKKKIHPLNNSNTLATMLLSKNSLAANVLNGIGGGSFNKKNPKPRGSNSSIREKIIEVESIRKKLKENYIKYTPNGAKKKFIIPHIIEKWQIAVKMLFFIDVRIFLTALKILGDIHLEFDEHEKAKNYYFYYKFLAFNLELLDEMGNSYEAIGNSYKFLNQYEKSIKCYKKQIELAWVLNDKESELRAYDNIGIQYFYLGNRDKAKYYHERMISGKIEKPKSEMKEKVLKKFEDKNFQMFFSKDMSLKSNEKFFQRLEELFKLFNNQKNAEVENIDIVGLHENLKNSFVSDVDITFALINEDLLKENDNENEEEELPRSKSLGRAGIKNSLKSKKVKRDRLTVLNENDANSNSVSDNMILSHLSAKRKEYSIERFDHLFKTFDDQLAYIKGLYQ